MSIYFYPCPAINPAILLPFIQFPESTSTQVLTGRVRCPGNKKLGTPESFPHQPLCAREEQEQQILPSSKLTCTLPDRGWKISFQQKLNTFRVYVDLPEGIVLIGIVTVTELQAKKCTQHKPSTQSPATQECIFQIKGGLAPDWVPRIRENV
jgi:hypothetical protein